MKRVVILQPGYLPWLGFFDLMHKADVFVVYDDVQYTIRDWRSRNRIKTPQGVIWLTVPVKSKKAREKLIKDVEIDNSHKWQEKHLKSLESFYKKGKFFDNVMSWIVDTYQKPFKFLIDLDMEIIFKVTQYLGIKSRILFSSEIPSEGTKDERLLSICKTLNATHYLSGNAAKAYLREEIFEKEGIKVEWHNYKHPYYNQLWLKQQGFISHLSIIDLLFNHGPESLDIITGKKRIPVPEGITIRHADEFKK